MSTIMEPPVPRRIVVGSHVIRGALGSRAKGVGGLGSVLVKAREEKCGDFGSSHAKITINGSVTTLIIYFNINLPST